jgi:3'-phosphoadenosine 5'-phosphosulfate sulfotransferase (PAPS reductase)/FAD synthetase
MVFGPCEEVVYLNTGTGPGDGAVSANGDWVRQWCESNGWPFREMETSEDYAELVGKNGFPGPSRHFIYYQRLKDRQLCKLAAETDGDLHCWTGIRRHESDRRMTHSYGDDDVRDGGRWRWHSPLSEFTDARVEKYREYFDLPVSPVSEQIGRSADCWCGCFGQREELIDLAAAGFEDHADWLESLDTPDDVEREKSVWGGYNWEKHDFAKEDDQQMTLCSDCGPDYPRNTDAE